MNRRTFIYRSGLGALSFGTASLQNIFGNPDLITLTILHTNDVHSRIDPFPMDGGRNQDLGGATRRAALIDQIRKENEHVILLDAGDMFQGTPYFNYFGGELEIKLMSNMGYDAATIGNHDFDAGIEGLAKQHRHANFPFVIGNYRFDDTPMYDKFKPYITLERGPLKIGVTGVGIELDGLVPKNLIGETQYLNPIERANHYAEKLKYEEKCDYVICLSHLGFRYKNDKVSDHVLAAESTAIDLIIGGHTHTFLDEPQLLKNKLGQPVLVNQAGWAGILLGRIDITFERNRKNRCTYCKNLEIQGS